MLKTKYETVEYNVLFIYVGREDFFFIVQRDFYVQLRKSLFAITNNVLILRFLNRCQMMLSYFNI